LTLGATLSSWAGDRSLEFADTLYRQGRYREAQVEYERAYFQEERLAGSSAVVEKILETLLLSGQGKELLSRAESLATSPSREIACLAGFYTGRAHYQQGRYSSALNSFERVSTDCPVPYADYGFYWAGLSRLRRKEFDEASASFARVSSASPLAPEAQSSAPRALDGKDLPWKSPKQAALLNLPLPGLGYLYAGYPRTALTAFVINGLFIWGTVASIQNHNTGAAVVLGLFAATWYFGGVYGAAGSARRSNEQAFDQFLSTFHEK
jgi:tetratricopeptide (TPR) repeat protein